MGSILLWSVIFIALIAIDIATSSFLFSFIAIGALVGAILSLFGVSLQIQIIVALITGIIAVSLGYPWAKKKFKVDQKKIPLMEETYLNKVMEAKEAITDKATLKIEGIYWTVINNGDKIEVGEKFRIISIEGTKFLIKKEEI